MNQCEAKSKRSGQRCKNWPIRGKNTCRFHGGCSTGPKTSAGKKRVIDTHYKHGYRSKNAIEENKRVRQLIKDSKQFLGSF